MKIGLLLLSIPMISCNQTDRSEANGQSESVYQIVQNKIQIRQDSKFFKHLKIENVPQPVLDSRTLSSVGYMIALSNPSGELSKSRVSWVELDHALSQSLGLNLCPQSPFHVGTAIGVSLISEEYLDQIKVGEPIRVFRYGLQQGHIAGTVLRILPLKDSELIQIVFKLSDGEDWLPGSNCEIEFPLVKTRPIWIPATALMHYGMREYVLKQVSPGIFIPKNVAIIQERMDQVAVIGGVLPGDQIVTRGSILLKPQLHKILQNMGKNPL
jgi:hypothetical protein